MQGDQSQRYEVVIIGAGPAGLASSYHLTRRGIRHVVLERGRVGDTWANLYDSLRLHTGRHLSALPGLRFPRGTPMFVTRAEFVEYLRRYTTRFSLPISEASPVSSAWREDGRWLILTSSGRRFESNVLIVATGIVSSPRIPSLAGEQRFRGEILHSVAYRSPERFRGMRVLVVGVGNSGAEIASELGRNGVDVSISVRSGANVVPLQILGIPIQYLGYLVRKLPRSVQLPIVNRISAITERRRGVSPIPKSSIGPLDAIPVIGFHLVDAISEGTVKLRGGIDTLSEASVRFADGSEEPFDVILLATGFRPALELFRDPIAVDERGFAKRSDRVTSATEPDLFFVGHNYDANGGLLNIRIDSQLVAQRVELRLAAAKRSGRSGETHATSSSAVDP